MTAVPTIPEMMKITVARTQKWNGLEAWSTLEWCGAMCGEAGEAANVAKKMRRHDAEVWNGHPTRYGILSRTGLKEKLAQELADTFIYILLCAAKENIDLEGAIVKYFNQKSREAGFTERF